MCKKSKCKQCVNCKNKLPSQEDIIFTTNPHHLRNTNSVVDNDNIVCEDENTWDEREVLFINQIGLFNEEE